jgi:hypothetical protein
MVDTVRAPEDVDMIFVEDEVHQLQSSPSLWANNRLDRDTGIIHTVEVFSFEVYGLGSCKPLEHAFIL